MPDDIPNWLEKLGLGKYADVFAENAINIDVLPHLSEEDLKELGLPLGHRRKLQAAIQTLADSNGPMAPSVMPDASPSSEAERRQLTVMFCDLVGSSALAERLDPEELHALLAQYQDTCANVIQRYEGHIARYVGDGLLVYFGYPQAHEDDPQRAVRTGLGIVDAIKDLNPKFTNPGVDLAVRIGITTGLVVAGDIGSGERVEEKAIVGETPNLAARLQGLAKPNTVVIGASTQQLVEGLFDCDALGAQNLKGISQPVTAYRVRDESSAPSRFEAQAARGLTPLVGREGEISLLLKRWEQAKEGEGQVVLLSGEAGIGKSRIVRGLREHLESEPHNRVLHYGSPYHRNSALHPVIDQLERALRFERTNSDRQRLDKIEVGLHNLALSVSDLTPLLASLLSLSTDGRYPLPPLSPEQLKRKTLEAFAAVYEAMASQRPVLMVVEDAHWIDPSTRELISLLIERLQRYRLFLLITCRPEFESPWSAHTNVTAFTLNRLSRKESVAMIAKVTRDKGVPDEVRDQIVAKTDGVPLFVEELTKTVLESDLLKDTGDRYTLSGPLPALAIPTSLQDSLMARLDRLEAVKEIAQLGAVIGREFSYQLLAGVSQLDDKELQDALGQLAQSELIFQRGSPPDATYNFKHALVQDAAYGSLLKSRRQKLHADIAKAIAKQRADLVETQPELLAHHYTRAGLPEPAIEHWQAAARRAIDRSAYLEAIEQLDQALAQITLLAPGEARDKLELELQVTKLGPIFPVKGYASPEALETSARALELSRIVGDKRTLFPALYGRWTRHFVRSNQKELFDLSQECLERASAAEYDAGCMLGHRMIAVALFFRGEVEKSRFHADQAVQLYKPEEHIPLVSRFGQDLKVQSMIYVALSDALLGNVDEALATGAEAIAHARDLNHANTLAFALWYCGVWLPSIIRDTEAVDRYGIEMLEFVRTHRLVFWEGIGLPHIAVNRHGKTSAEAVADGEKAIDIWRHEHAGSIFVPEILCRIAEEYLDDGNLSEAERILSEAAALMDSSGELYWQPELYRLRAQMATMVVPDEPQAAIATYERAIAIAHERNTRLLELRAATGFARLLADRGDGAHAKEVLAPVYDWFTGGFDKPDLVEAKAMLDTLD